MLVNLQEQFHQEATILAQLEHPNLVGVTDFFEEDGNAFLVMKFVEGENLAEHIERVGMLSETMVLTLAVQLLDALSYCHGKGVIHRDIKPQNIIIRPSGQAVLVDFGLSKLWNPGDPRTKTVMRGMGTPEYAPPEQYDANLGHTDQRSDIYSLGATLYHALAGKAPPTATLRIANPESFSKAWIHVRGVGARTRAAVNKALELQCAQRWESAVAMASGLGLTITDWQNNLAAFTPPADGSTLKIEGTPASVMAGSGTRSGSRRRWFVWGGVTFLVLIAVGLFIGGMVTGIIPSFLRGFSQVASVGVGNITATATQTLTTVPDAVETVSVTATPTLTSTPVRRPTATRTPRVRSTPSATATEEDVAALSINSPTPTADRGSPTLRPSATSTPASAATSTTTPAPAASGAWVTFEEWGAWTRGNQPYGDFVQSSAQVKSGKYAARLSYNFPAVQDDYVVFKQSRGIGGEPNTIGAWVYGDGSGHFLNIWVQDSQSQIWSVHLGQVGSAGWKQMVGWLSPDQPWPSGHISGPDNGVVDYPVRFYALVLDRPARGPQKGQLYVDDITAWRGNVPAPAPTSAPTPVPTVATGGTATPVGVATATAPAELPPGVVVPSAPQLVLPKYGKTLDNPIEFQWMGLLGSGQSYVVHAENIEPGHGYAIDSPPLTDSEWAVELPGEAFGEWVWEVRVVQNGVVLTTSSQGKFWHDPFLHRD